MDATLLTKTFAGKAYRHDGAVGEEAAPGCIVLRSVEL
jgi:hypothetical protein